MLKHYILYILVYIPFSVSSVAGNVRLRALCVSTLTGSRGVGGRVLCCIHHSKIPNNFLHNKGEYVSVCIY